MNECFVSVIIPAYNCANYIAQALESALCQDVPMEILVIDDCSKDNLDKVMAGFLSYPQVRYVKNDVNLGVAKTRNRGVALAKGNYVAFLDADDCWEKDKLKKQLKLIQEKGTVICSTARELMNPDGTLTGYVIPVKTEYTFRDLCHHNQINCSSVLIRTEVAREFPMHHDDSHEDYLMWLEVLKKYGRGCAVNEPLLKYRISNTGKSGSKWSSAKMTYMTTATWILAFSGLFCALSATLSMVCGNISSGFWSEEAMELEVLLSCMYQQDTKLVHDSRLTGNVLVVNQCDQEETWEETGPQGRVRMLSTTERGLTKSRNMAIRQSRADVCLLCDDDEIFEPGYDQTVLSAYQQLPQADVIIFKIKNRPASFDDRIQRLTFPKTMKVSSVQISFRRGSLLRSGVYFDEHLGAGTGNGGEEELKFLLDCQRAGLKIYYVPGVIASVAQTESTWFHGFDETFFENRGATTRYILGYVLAVAYGIYYVLRKRSMYQQDISPKQALRATFRGIRKNKISKQVARERSPSDDRRTP